MARLFLVRIEEFKAANQVGEQQFQVQKQHALSAEFALLETPDEIHHFIKSKFELEDRQVKLYMKTFKKYDFDARGTTPICVRVHAYNFSLVLALAHLFLKHKILVANMHLT